MRRNPTKWGAIIAAIAIGSIVGMGHSNSSPSLWILILVGTFFAGQAILQPRFWMGAFYFLSTVTISLSVYQIPLPGGQTLQLFRALLLISIMMWASAVALQRYRVVGRVPMTGVCLIFVLLYVLLSYVLSRTHDMNSLNVLVAISFGLLYALWLPQIVRSSHELRLTFAGIIAANVLVIIFAVYQYTAWLTGLGMQGYSFRIPLSSIWGDQVMSSSVSPSRAGALFRLTLPFGSSSHLGSFIAITMLITLALQALPSLPKRFQRWLTIYHTIMFFLLIATLSRGAWISWSAGFLVLLLYQRPLTIPRGIYRVCVTLVVLGSVLLITSPELARPILGRFSSSVTASSDQLHLSFANVAWELFSSRPIFGQGIGSYASVTGIAHPHNIYLHFLAELGLAGTVLWLVWCAVVIWYGHRAIVISAPRSSERQLATGLLAAFAAILVNNLFQQCLYAGFALFIPGLIGAVSFIGNGSKSTASWKGTNGIVNI